MKKNLPCSAAEILLPKNIDSRWAVVACDQFTSKPSYWDSLSDYVGDAPSTLRLVLPECYLETELEQVKTDAISANMKRYLDENVFAPEKCGYVLATRKTHYGRARTGLVLKIDLNDYEFAPGNHALIRATEGTVIERIPPRVKIRNNCTIELPHIMVLIDDTENAVMNAAKNCKKQTVYDVDLNKNGGHIVGEFILEEDASVIKECFKELLNASVHKYGEPFLMAVGDGNHSLASAKACYLQAVQNGLDAQRLRYALVEVVNIYDEGIQFEPIHRVLFGINAPLFMDLIGKASAKFTNKTKMISGGVEYELGLPENAIEGVAFVQNFIDGYIKEHGGKVDYIHGLQEITEHGAKLDAVSIELKSMSKSELFEYIMRSGVLPRKTFSMGEAEEKRYYMEARRIR